MKEYDYLIIGGGMAADAAVKGIREVDSSGTIGMLAKECEPPYQRPPLSKTLWSGDKAVGDIACHTALHGADIMTNRIARMLDPATHTVSDDRETFRYGRVLLATGGEPRRLPFGNGNIIYFRTLGDYRELLRQSGEKSHFGVIGGGFIGCELAAALAARGREITMVFPEKEIGAGVFPREVSKELTDCYRSHGVEVVTGVKASSLECVPGKCKLKLESGREVAVDGLVAGIGIEPATQLAANAGLEVDNGILVNGLLQATHADVFAAGDVANFYNPALTKRMRVEHEDNALAMGRTAGRNMAGAEETYTRLPHFYSDLFDVGYEAVGELDISYETFGIWNGLCEKGIWAYLRDGRVRGVLLWNLFGKTDAGRALIAGQAPIPPAELEQRLRAILNK